MTSRTGAPNITKEERRRLAEDAYDVQRAAMGAFSEAGVKPTGMTRDLLAQVGQHVLPCARRDDDADAAECIIKLLQSEGTELGAAIALSMFTPPGDVVTIGSLRWAQEGFPQVAMGHKYAAALASTVVPEDMYEFVKSPWRAWVLLAPNDMIFIKDDNTGRLVDVRYILVVRPKYKNGQHGWFYCAFTDSSVTLWRNAPNLNEFMVEHCTNVWEGCTFILDMEDVDQRAHSLIANLIASACLAMSDPANIKAPRPSKPGSRSKSKRTSSELPLIRTYTVGQPIQLDVRQQVRDFSRGSRGGMPTVQSRVRGHWKMQAYGPGRTLRKPIQVDPYTRGPEDAPVKLRSHHLEK